MMIVPSAVATAPAMSERRSAIPLPLRAARQDATIRPAASTAIVASGRGRQVLGWLEDAGLVLLLALAFPLVILVVGAPVALVVRLLIEIGRR
jgi:hypothetical protein